jgi:hypothetical protein
MNDHTLIIAALGAKPFEPFVLTLVTDQRIKVPTKEHLTLPPLDEYGKRPKLVVVFNVKSALPRYLTLESIISLDHGD